MSRPFELRDEPQAANYRAAGLWGKQRLNNSVRMFAAAAPERLALIDGARHVTYRELYDLSDSIALGLLERGVEPGDVISVQLPNWWEFAPLLVAIEKIGAVMNPLTTILRERELRQMLQLAGSKILVVPDAFGGFSFASMAESLRDELPDLNSVVVLRDSSRNDWASLTSRSPGERELAEIRSRSPDASAVCELAFSSGTTGEPKGVLHTHESAMSTVGSTIRRQVLGEGIVFHVATPVGHNAGYFYGVRIALQNGGTAVFQDTWNARRMVELIAEHSVAFTMGTTTLLIDFLEAAIGWEDRLSSLRNFTCGGAAIPPAVARECEERFPGVLCPVFGMTEMGHVTSTGPDSPRVKALETDGVPLPEMDMKIVGKDGSELPEHKEGTLMFRGPFLFAGYVQGRQFTERQFDDAGFFDTGDIAYRDRDGYIRITGRVKDLIIRGGENIPLREIEDLLAEHPLVAAAAIVGMPDARLGERAVACVRLRGSEPLTLADMRSFLADKRVARQFWPESVEVFDTFPSTPAGKIKKADLRRNLLERE